MRRFVVFAVFSVLVSFSRQEVSDSLQLVHVFFRHGARTPEDKDLVLYPNDPYKLEAFLPMGYGQLTNLGKRQAYTLGKILRNRYDKFLGNIYNPDLVYAQSTDYDRTKMTALLVLAGLFPPKGPQTWIENFPWMPIPLAYEKDKEDYFLRRPTKFCPTYIKELDNVLQSEETIMFMKEHQESFNYLTNHTGAPITTLQNFFGLYQTLTAEKNLNFTLPEWTTSVYPEEVTNMAIKQCQLENSNDILKKLNGGRSLQKIIEHLVNKTTNNLNPRGRKIFLYSGHENNVLNILAALGMYDHHFPNYSSAVIIELHSLNNDKFGVKILYQRDLVKDAEVKKLKDCEELCPLDKFLELTKHVVPKNYTAECDSSIYLD